MFRIFKRMGKREWTLLAISVALVVAQVYMDLRIPEYMSTITRLVKTPGSMLNEIWITGA